MVGGGTQWQRQHSIAAVMAKGKALEAKMKKQTQQLNRGGSGRDERKEVGDVSHAKWPSQAILGGGKKRKKELAWR